MDVLSDNELDGVAGGFLQWAVVLGAMVWRLDTVTAGVTGAVDGFMDGWRGAGYTRPVYTQY